MATTAELIRASLETELVNVAARLAELDAVAVDTRARMTYTIGALTYDWNGYRAALQRTFADLESRLKGIQMIDGPFTVLDSPYY